jgi:trans-aconitate methyltransferase
MTNVWDAQDYDNRFGFVARSGDALIDLLAAVPGQRVLDLGCGTGRHAGLLADQGVRVLGLDQDEAMLAKAREDNPGLTFVHADARSFDLGSLGQDEPFEGCLSNAALHWMTPQDQVLANVRAVLAPGARFVAEMGGAGNIAALDRALRAALREVGLADVSVVENFFPTVGEESVLLETSGFRVEQMLWFMRPTPLAAGSTAADWTRHFRAATWQQVPGDRQGELAQRVDAHAERAGLRGESGWLADYCRLRFLAVAV